MISILSILFLILLLISGCGRTSQRHYNIMTQRDIFQPGPASPGDEALRYLTKGNTAIIEFKNQQDSHLLNLRHHSVMLYALPIMVEQDQNP